MLKKKWICRNCGHTVCEKPKNRAIKCEKCHKARYKLNLLCECGKWFEANSLKSQFCTKECRYKYKPGGTGKKGKTYPHLQRAPVKICPVCGKEFRAIKEQNGKFNGKIIKRKFCSKECWSKRGEILYEHKCLYCGEAFKTSGKRIRTYCSRICAYKDRIGIKAPNFKDGKSLERDRARLAKEVTEWREVVYKRDNYTCQECGAKGNIHAHHIKSWAEYPELRFDIDNGVTLCEKCHGKIHGVDFSKRKNKICPDCGKTTKGRGKLGLCRVCALKRSYLSRKLMLNLQGTTLSEKMA